MKKKYKSLQYSVLDMKLIYLYLISNGDTTVEDLNRRLNFDDYHLLAQTLELLEERGLVIAVPRIKENVNSLVKAVVSVGGLAWACSDKRKIPPEEEASLILSSLPQRIRSELRL